MNREQARTELRKIFKDHLGISSKTTQQLVPLKISDGKLYEAYVLGLLVERLVVDEKYSLRLVGGSKIKLKSAPGPINRSYPHIELWREGSCRAELWTDVEFLSLSYQIRGSGSLTMGDYHELDILIVDVGISGRPGPGEIWLGVECKNTGYEKGLLKEILGIRRELSLLQEPLPTKFMSWPRIAVPANPGSCLLVYSTDPKVNNYAAPGDVFGIDFVYAAV